MTSPVDTSVKYFHSGMVGAPVLSGLAGSLIAVLDACLVNGFALKSVDSLVVASNVATIGVSTGITAEVGAVVLVTGATPAALNGEQKITAIGANSASFATTGITDQTATGAITVKMAPAGWSKAFSGTNKAAYKATDVTATGHYLRVNDAATQAARVMGYESMVDVDTGTAGFPTELQRTGGLWWSKSNLTTSVARGWVLVANGKFFSFSRTHQDGYPSSNEITAFGDCVSLKAGDAFCSFVTGMLGNVAVSGAATANQLWGSSSNTLAEWYMSRSYTALGSSIQLKRNFVHPCPSTLAWDSGGSNAAIPYPNYADGGLYVSPQFLVEGTAGSLRGNVPGAYGCPQTVADGQFATGNSVTGVTGLPGRTLKAVTCGASPLLGVMFFDITGPWG